MRKGMELLDIILDRFEESKKWDETPQGRKSLRIEEVHYQSIGRKEVIQQALSLKAQNLITIKWYNSGFDIELLRYDLANIPTFYQLANRQSKKDIIAAEREEILSYAATIQCQFIKNYFDHLLLELSKGKYTKTKEELSEKRKLYLCLQEIDSLEELMYLRFFSKRVLKNSKEFEEKYKKIILKIARDYHSDVDEEMNDSEVLSVLNLEQYSAELMVKGPLVLMLEGKKVSLSDFIYGTTINSQMLKVAKIAPQQQFRQIIMIENKANFMQVAYQEDTLYLFTHGFLAPVELRFVKSIVEELKDQVTCYHSGDLDYGGICIYRYLKSRISKKLRPYLMDKTTYLKYLEYAEPMKEQTFGKLKKLYEQSKYELPELKELMESMMEKKMVLEQEAIDMKKNESKKKVAFICVHNSCRSQIAEALGKHLASDVFESYSAGTETKPRINQDAVRLMKELYGIDMEETQHSKLFEEIPKPDIAISMGCNVGCPYVGMVYDDNWQLEDPTGKSDEEFIRIIKKIHQNIEQLKDSIRSTN